MSDYALTESVVSGVVMAHRPDCVYARMLAEMGEPVVTLFGCEKPLPANLKRCSCLEGEDE